MQDLSVLVELTLVPGIGSLTQARLTAACPDISMVFQLGARELASLQVPAEACEALRARRYRPAAEEIVEWCLREGCRLLVRGRPGYPRLLEEIFDPPLVLYARGDVAVLEQPCVAVVGTRRPTPYGLQMAEGLAYDLGARGITVVSGLARGIDAAAHRGCLSAGGRTAAVLGSGIDVIYPPEHYRMSREIESRGAMLSEFAPGTSPAPQNFPVRNRIISGLSLGTLVIEAGEYSGSLITARLAMEQNREVFALPGNLTSPQSFGPNFLIKQGAKLVQSWRDIVDEFPAELRYRLLQDDRIAPMEHRQLELFDEDESAILAALDTDRAVLFDRILHSTGMEISRLSNLLLKLEMRGYVRMLPGGLYVKVARPPGKN